MQVMVDLCVVPMGVGVSVSRYVAACEQGRDRAEVTHTRHAYGRTIDGEGDEVFEAIKRCHEVVHEMGVPRIFTTLKVGTRTDRRQTAAEKVASVEDKLAASGGE